MTWGRRGPRTKYAAVATVIDGIRFHSKREAHRFGQLVLLQRAGQIAALEVQPVYRLHGVNLTSGEVGYVGDYRGDFRYHDVVTGATVVEDVKGMATLPLSRWKQKHCFAEYGVRVLEVR